MCLEASSGRFRPKPELSESSLENDSALLFSIIERSSCKPCNKSHIGDLTTLAPAETEGGPALITAQVYGVGA